MTNLEQFLKRAVENIRAARLLLHEGFPNIAASRAYYAMFYNAEALLLSRGFSFSSHSAVIAAYGKEFSRSSDLDRKFHHYLVTAFDTRQIGDYVVIKDVEPVQAEELIEWAEEFYTAAVEYLKNHPLSMQSP